jgi:lytic murein transglycosylase
MIKRMTPTHRLRATALLATIVCAPVHTAWAQTTAEPLPSACLAQLSAKALAAGVSSDTFEQAMQGVVARPELMDNLNYQPEFKLPIWDYLASLVDGERVLDGMSMLAQYKDELAAIQQTYGVDPATVVAVWGVESNYGQNTGGRDIVESLATLSCMGRRQNFFSGEFVAALRILQAGDFERDLFKGSWAGAFGQTQFMPSTFLRLAVDGDADGKRNLITNPVDALASTANFLKRAGWRDGETWGFEVKLGATVPTVQGRKSARDVSYWAAQGITRADGSALAQGPVSGNTDAALLLPAGDQGPAFLLLRNFKAIYSYNASESYGLAIAHLSDRLRGADVFATPWPTDDAGLSRAEKRDIQTMLLARGHEIGAVDGALGSKSQAAIKLEQQRLGHEPSGRAGQKLLKALQALQAQR